MARDRDEDEKKRRVSVTSLDGARNGPHTDGPAPMDEVLRLFAEETDASADLGRAPDAAERMALIDARHEAALARLRGGEERRPRPVTERESKSSGW